MSDFMIWLYAQYIRPYIKEQEPDDGDLCRMSLLEGETTRQEWEDVEAVLRFHAAHAFLLGVKTGAGLAPEFPATADSCSSSRLK